MKHVRAAVIGSLVLALALFVGGLFSGYAIFRPRPSPAPEVKADFILTALHDRGFLVTQTYIFDQPVTIKKSTGSAFKDLFLGQTITARGTMEVNLGIDLAKVAASDVSVSGDTVTVTVPSASLFNTRLVGPLELRNEQGLLKRLLNSEDGYNEALEELSRGAEAVASRPELVERANERAVEDVRRLLGYAVKGKTIVVELK